MSDKVGGGKVKSPIGGDNPVQNKVQSNDGIKRVDRQPSVARVDVLNKQQPAGVDRLDQAKKTGLASVAPGLMGAPELGNAKTSLLNALADNEAVNNAALVGSSVLSIGFSDFPSHFPSRFLNNDYASVGVGGHNGTQVISSLVSKSDPGPDVAAMRDLWAPSLARYGVASDQHEKPFCPYQFV